MIPVIDGLSAVESRFDAFILDLWGVIHDGVQAYPGAADTLAALKAAGKKTLLLSNAPRRAEALVGQMTRLGIARDLYGQVLSSGEAVHRELASPADPFYRALAGRLYHLGPERDRNVFEGLGLPETDSIEAAGFILNTGPCEWDEKVADYQGVLDRAILRDLPMVCANPDHMVIRQGQPIVCAGAIAACYGAMGGRVSFRGKPDPAIYSLALAMLETAPSRICAVGDALETDIKGANGAGLASVLVTRGIHAAELGITPGAIPSPASLESLAARHGERPGWAMPVFAW